MFILIVIINTMYASLVEFQEFNTGLACEQAADFITKSLNGVKVVCIPK